MLTNRQIYVVASRHPDTGEAIRKLNEGLQIISEWSKSYGLTINSGKSQVSIMGSTKQLKNLLLIAFLRYLMLYSLMALI